MMKAVSLAVAKGSWKGWTVPAITIPVGLRLVADTFVDLQDKRHIADYDNSEVWGWSQVTTSSTTLMMRSINGLQFVPIPPPANTCSRF